MIKIKGVICMTLHWTSCLLACRKTFSATQCPNTDNVVEGEVNFRQTFKCIICYKTWEIDQHVIKKTHDETCTDQIIFKDPVTMIWHCLSHFMSFCTIVILLSKESLCYVTYIDLESIQTLNARLCHRIITYIPVCLNRNSLTLLCVTRNQSCSRVFPQTIK